jgi:ribose transport system ATP-binding protein
LIDNLASQGAGIVLSSSDPGELIGMCDRILVMMRGRLVHETKADNLSIDRLVAMTTGAEAAAKTAHVG